MSLPYKRIMLKLSGEMLGGNKGYGIEGEALELIAGEIASLHNLGAEVGVVIGGGNIFAVPLQRKMGDRSSLSGLYGNARYGNQWPGLTRHT